MFSFKILEIYNFGADKPFRDTNLIYKPMICVSFFIHFVFVFFKRFRSLVFSFLSTFFDFHNCHSTFHLVLFFVCLYYIVEIPKQYTILTGIEIQILYVLYSRIMVANYIDLIPFKIKSFQPQWNTPLQRS